MSEIPFPGSADVVDPDEPEPEPAFMAWLGAEDDYDDQPVEPVDLLPPITPLPPVGEGEHEVGPHECIGSIATQYGVLPETLWAANESLRTSREDEFVLLPHDRVTIPERTPAKKRAATGTKHVYRRKRVPLHLRLDLSDEEGEPYANTPFVLEGENFSQEGVASDSGHIESWIPPELERATLRFPELDGDTMELEVGTLEPVTTIRGVQARLNNLSFWCGPVTGELNLPTIMALGRFRVAHGLSAQPDAILDEPTLRKLVEQYGC